MSMNYTSYTLTAETIVTITREIADYVNTLGDNAADATRIRLTVEELLLRILKNPDSENEVRIGYGRKYGNHLLRIDFEGAPYDATEDDDDEWSSRLMRNLGLSPSWSYKNKTNQISLMIRERSKMSSLLKILLALLLSVIVGICGQSIPDDIRLNIRSYVLEPASSAFLGLLNTFAGFMIAFTICSGILGIGNTNALKKAGKNVLLRLVLFSFVLSTASILLSIPILGVQMVGSSGAGAASPDQISKMLFGIFPKDPITPFTTGNSMQIIVISVLIGFVLLSLGERVRHTGRIVDEASLALQHATSTVCSLIPVFVFTELTTMIWKQDVGELLSLWKPLCLVTGLLFLYGGVMLFLTSWRLKLSPGQLLRIVMPAYIAGLTTASGVATLSVSMEICEEKLGIDKNLIKFAYPIGNVICKYATLAFVCVACTSIASTYDVSVSITWIIVAVISSTLLTSAVAPVVGATMTIYAILIAQLGLPQEGILIAVALDVVVDYLCTGFNAILLIFQMSSVAKRIGKIESVQER
ncbi:MAG: cation:dicarboxylase symporter family transporter [Eubacterium sp.]|nr:cation:dicarboxylase symporter family transporter [Eubacterium sp.]